MTETIDTENTCNRCAWWGDLGVDGIGQCRRYAPRPRTGSSDVIWPITEEFDYCGEFEEEDGCWCDDDETCHICADDRTDEVFELIVDQLTAPPRRRWLWRSKAGE